MNKVIASLALIGSLSIGGVLTYSMIGDNEKPKQEEAVKEVTSTSDSSKEVGEISAPTERTVNTNGDMPWFYMTPEQIKEATDNGEIAHLFSDAEAVENDTITLAANPDTTPYNKEELSENWVRHIDAFIYSVKDYHPDKEEYFAKLEEAKNALSSFDYESVPGLIEEAKSLR
jgi:hypothetical protein